MKSINEHIDMLCPRSDDPEAVLQFRQSAMPDTSQLKEAIDLIKTIMFPGYFGHWRVSADNLRSHIGVDLERLTELLTRQIGDCISHFSELCKGLKSDCAPELTERFIDTIPEIKRLLCMDIKAVFDGDPAAKSHDEVLFCYPGIQAMINYRIAHSLLQLGIPVMPRIITEMAHSATGIDIHPGAQIGESFSIDHGTGVVIGETCIIGRNVRLYQGVTLGARSFTLDEHGLPIDMPRHPIIEDNVIIYSNSTILGRITIGHDSIIGGNVWPVHSVPPYSRIQQRRAMSVSFIDGAGI